MEKIIALLLLTYSFNVMYLYVLTQRVKPIYWAHWMHHTSVRLFCWSTGLLAVCASLVLAMMSWGFIKGFAIFAILTLVMAGIIRGLAYVFPLQVMLATLTGLIGLLLMYLSRQ